MMTKVLNWLVKSSANPDEVAMTIKGILLLSSSSLVSNLGVLGINLTEQSYQHDVSVALAVFGVILTGLGLVRKIILSTNTLTAPKV